MPQIKIIEMSKDGSSGIFQAQVSIDGGADYPVQVSSPFEAAAEEQLEWYFEEHLRQPFLNRVKAQAAAQSIQAYGERLFEQVFVANPKLYGLYLPYRERLEALSIEIEGSPAFHALHWEALKDPELPHALALDATMIRRRRVAQAIEAEVTPAQALRVLVVTARPHGETDVAYRTISRPLVEAIRQSKTPVDLDILRPGTYAALENHLRAVSDQPGKGSGFYHIIHFDTHGALLTHAQFLKGSAADRHAFRRYGRGEIAPYEGQKAFLFFEGEDGGADAVEAGELASLLTTHRIPITLLNACQSGKQVGDSETSLGSRLIEGGVQLVLAMGYTITVSAAELLMATLYQRLFSGVDVATAIRSARRELYNRKDRRAYFNQTIALEDWLLPVVYQNRPLQLTTRPATPEEDAAYWRKIASNFPMVEPRYGFFGRDLDILAIERRLLRHNQLLVRGMGGAGKTTLLKYLGHWWQTTDFVEQVWYFGYDEQGWTRQHIQHQLAKSLWGEADYHAYFVPLPAAAQQAKLAQALRSQRHLLILDNLESITGTHLAIAHGLAAEEQQALREFLHALQGGQTLVLLGSRSGEGWLAAGTFDDAVYDLRGLDPEAASQLADRVLARYQAEHQRSDAEFAHLLKLLAGFPLALEVVLPNLAQQTPGQILSALQAGGVDIQTGDSEAKTENILRCIDYSHSNLDPKAQQLLACLAPFSGVINTQYLEHYSAALQQQPLLQDYPFEAWEAVLQQAVNWGLLSPQPDYPPLLQLQPVLPYFLRRQGQAATERSAQIEEAFCQYYDGLSEAIADGIISKQADERSLGMFFAQQEYENLLQALHLRLAAQQSIWNPHRALSRYLDATHNEARGLALGEQVLARLESYPAEALAGPLDQELVSVIDGIAKRYLNLKRYAEAEAAYKRALALWLSNTAYPPQIIKQRSESIYHQLGRVAEAQQQWPQAQQYFQQALAIQLGFNDRYHQAGTYHQLGRVAEEQRQWPQAEQHYQQALAIYVEFNDRYEQADTYHQLGSLAQAQRQWPQAEQYYQQALAIKIEFNDCYKQASTYHHLGTVAHEQRQWPQAEQYYQQALAIQIEFNDRYSQASTYQNLGIVAQEQRQWPQAEQYCQQALAIQIEFNDHYSRASTYHNLGVVAQEQRQWPQAEHYYQQALAIKLEFNDRYRQASTYHQLGSVAQAQWQWPQAEQYYQQALAIKIEFDDRYSQASTYGQLGNLFKDTERWHQALKHYLAAFEIFSEYKDEYSQGVVIKCLANLWSLSGDDAVPQQLATLAGVSREEAEALLRSYQQDE